MALIKCPECGKEISDKSLNCIHCGFPLETQILPTEENQDNRIYKIILFSCVDTIATIKLIREIKGISLAESKEYLDHMPVILLENLSKNKAEEVKSKFDSIGANAMAVWMDENNNVEVNKKIVQNPNDNEKRLAIYDILCGHESMYGVWHCQPNSANGVSVRFSFKNIGKKPIKYATFWFTPYNNVGDSVYCSITNESSRSVRATGVINVGEAQYNKIFLNAWYNASITSVKVDCVELEYMDGSFETIGLNQIELKSPQNQQQGGCYIATAVYGSYDCPQVWTLRRYRDYSLSKTWYGRAFIHLYYAISPKLVKYFGNTKVFKIFFLKHLDKLVRKLQSKGIKSSPYSDKTYK